MKRSLTFEEFLRLPDDRRAAVSAWVRSEGIPFVRSVTVVAEGVVSCDGYEMEPSGRWVRDGDHVAQFVGREYRVRTAPPFVGWP